MKKNQTCTKPLESVIQKEIIKFLHLKGVFAWVNKTQGTYDPVKRCFRAGTTMRGISDILGVLDCGTFLAIEVKRPGGKATPEQIDFIANINKAGGKAFIARSVEEVQEYLKAYLEPCGTDDTLG